MWWGPKAPQLALCRHTGQNLHNKWARYRTPGGKRSHHGPPVELAAPSAPVCVTEGLASPAPAHHHPPDPQCRPVVQDAPLAGARSRAARSRSTTWQENRRSWTGEGTRSRLKDQREKTHVCTRAASIWLSSKDLKSDRRGRRRGEHLPCTIPLRESRGQTLR